MNLAFLCRSLTTSKSTARSSMNESGSLFIDLFDSPNDTEYNEHDTSHFEMRSEEHNECSKEKNRHGDG